MAKQTTPKENELGNQKVPKIREVYAPEGEEKEVLDHVYKRFQEMRDNGERAELAPKWPRWREAWEAKRPQKDKDDWQSNYYVPLTTSIIESILSEMIDKSPRPIIKPRSTPDISRAIVMKHVFNYTWEVSDSDLAFYDICKDAITYGTGIGQEYYFQDRRIIKKLKELQELSNGKTKPIYEEQEINEYDDSMLEAVPLEDFYVDEIATDVNRGAKKARDCIRRYRMHISAFRDFFSGDVWDPLGNAQKVVPGIGNPQDYYQYYQPESLDQSEMVDVLWYWGRRPKDLLVIVANDIVIKFGPNPYRHKQLPFAKAIDIRRTHKFYGKGEADILDSIQEEMNTQRRMTMDRNLLDTDKTFLVSNREVLSQRAVVAKPHNIIRVDDPKSVVPLEYRDLPNSVAMGYAEMNKDAIKVTGIEDRFQSVNAPTTATEAAIQKESVLRRVRMKLRFIEKGFLVDVARLRCANIIQFYSIPKLEAITGKPTEPLYKEQVRDAYSQGRLTLQNKKPYRKSYMSIPIEGKRLEYDERGKLIETPYDGTSFFEAAPETYTPYAQGGFSISFEAGSSMPVSETLMQTKAVEIYDRLMPLALQGVGGYDPTKIGDFMVEEHNFDPERFKNEAQEANTEGKRGENIVALAQLENNMVLSGKPIPENGTPYANPPHTEIHIALLKSPKLDPKSPEYRVLLKHTLGEILAQEQRQEGIGNQGEQPQPGQGMAPQAPQDPSLQQIQPGRVEGGADVPQNPTGQGGQNFFGKMRNMFGGGVTQ